MVTPTSSRKKPASGAPGMKALLAVGALAGVLGGWAEFATEKTRAGAVAATVQDTSSWVLSAPLPTLVAPPTGDAAAQLAPTTSIQTQQALRPVSAPPPPVVVTRSSR